MWLSDMQSMPPSCVVVLEAALISVANVCTCRDWCRVLLWRYAWSTQQKECKRLTMKGGMFLFGGVLMFFDRSMYAVHAA